MKKLLKLMLVAIILIAISCSQEAIIETSPENLNNEVLKRGKDVPRPVSIVLEGIDDQDGVGGTFTARMTHLGKVEGTVAPGTFLPNDDGTFTFETLEGEVDVISAPNGDKLYSRGLLTFIFDSESTATYTGTITFVDGTGRFVGASGSMNIENGVLEFIGLNDLGGPRAKYSHNGHGTITY